MPTVKKTLTSLANPFFFGGMLKASWTSSHFTPARSPAPTASNCTHDFLQPFLATLVPLQTLPLPLTVKAPLVLLLQGLRSQFDALNQKNLGEKGGDRVKQTSLSLPSTEDKLDEVVHSEIVSLSLSFLNLLCGSSSPRVGAFSDYLEERKKKLVVTSCVRYYPSGCQDDSEGHVEERLGSHCDGNLITFLWESREGLQVPSPDSRVSPASIMALGLPSFTPAPPPQISWITVCTTSVNSSPIANPNAASAAGAGAKDSVSENNEDVLLVSLGSQFFDVPCLRELRGKGLKRIGDVTSETSGDDTSMKNKVECPLYHRVAVKGNLERISVPFLVRIVDKNEGS